MSPPFRAEHIGSLLRPATLLSAHAASPSLSPSALQTIENTSITTCVKLQQSLNFRAVTDGEYRRAVFWGTFFEDLEGMTEIRNPSMSIFRPYVPDIAGFIEKGDKPGQSCICTSKILHKGKKEGSALVNGFEYLKTLVPEDRWGNIKVTMITPSWYHLRYKDGKAYPRDVYKNDEEYFEDVAKAISKELDLLYEAGVRNVQFDDPNFAYFCDEKMIQGWKDDTSNTTTLEETLDAYIKCYNDSIANHVERMHFGVHICRGNFMGSRHFSEGSYDAISQKLFNNLHVHTYYLEYDTPRAGSFAALSHLPHPKSVILGLITSKFPPLEDIPSVIARIHEAADIIGGEPGGVGGKEGTEARREALKRMGVSPQCGFASHEEGNSLGWADMEKKLELVRKVADAVWPGEA